MAQFGVGPEIAAQCPQAPTPDGWRPWLDADGPIPDALAKRAAAFAGDLSIPRGATESYPLPGVTVLIRIEPRIWSRDDKGNLIQGCFRVGGIYLPAPSVTAPQDSGVNKAVGVFTVISLAVGTAVTLANWKRAA